MIRLASVIALMVFSFWVRSQDYTQDIQKADELTQVENRPVILFFSAEWCKYCTHMKSELSSIDDTTDILQNDFYFFGIDEKEYRSITLFNTQYNYVPRGIDVGQHELISKFAQTEEGVSFPTIVVMWNDKVVFKENSFMTSEETYAMLKKVLNSIKR